MIPDEEAAKHGYVRIVDESGEDYWYSDGRFIAIDLSVKRSSVLSSSGRAGVQPSSERGLRLPRRSASEKTGDIDVFVEVGPVNAFATADQTPIGAFRRCPMRQARVPRQRYAHA
ncbi:MAG: hypothetical protein ACRDH5_15030, partial [bacterium]